MPARDRVILAPHGRGPALALRYHACFVILRPVTLCVVAVTLSSCWSVWSVGLWRGGNGGVQVNIIGDKQRPLLAYARPGVGMCATGRAVQDRSVIRMRW